MRSETPETKIFQRGLLSDLTWFLLLPAGAMVAMSKPWSWKEMLFISLFTGAPLLVMLFQIRRVSFSPEGQVTIAETFRSQTFPASEILKVEIKQARLTRHYVLETKRGSFLIDSALDWKGQLLATLEKAASR